MKYLVIAFLLLSLPTKKYELGLNLKVGETYSQKIVGSMEMEQDVSGFTQKINTTMTGGMNYKVVQYENDQYEMEVWYTQIGMEMDTGYATMNFSSDSDDPDDPMSPFMKALVDKPFNMSVHRSGTVKDIRGLSEIFSSLFDEYPEIPETEKAQITAQLQESYGDKALRGNMEMLLAIYPSEAVAIGDHWNNEINIGAGMEMVIKNDFSLTEVTGEHITISGISEIGNSGESTQLSGMDASFSMKGQMDSTIKIDPKTNWILEATIVQNITGTISLAESPQVPGGMDVPFTMIQRMNVED